MKKVIVKKNRYVDSVSLMGLSDKVSTYENVKNALVTMATANNILNLKELGYELEEEADANDLVIAITADKEDDCDRAIQYAMDIIDHKVKTNTNSYDSLDEIDLSEDEYDLVQVSLPGEYAYEQADKALDMGMDVFIFSDNVPLEQELALKEKGRRLGKLVMGPDCGVGLLKGTCLAAGSIYKDGCVGIVGASGSGAQEIGCIVERCGLGVSELIGTGGRDLFPEIGGIMMIEGMKRLDRDEKTKVIVLVSKLADYAVMDKVLSEADRLVKPVVAIFLGSDEALYEKHPKIHATFSLEGCALKAVELVSGKEYHYGLSDEQLQQLCGKYISRLDEKQKYFRGLYCGGTFTEEGLIYYTSHSPETKFYTNLENKYAEKLADSHKSVGHSILDLGAEDFTAEAPHPVFDPMLRARRTRQELEDDEVAVILIDFITGPGVSLDPFTPYYRLFEKEKNKEKGGKIIIANVCGTPEDPQDIEGNIEKLKQLGVIVAESNYQAARIALTMLKQLERR